MYKQRKEEKGGKAKRKKTIREGERKKEGRNLMRTSEAILNEFGK